ncbi:ABC transporter permease/M1 family aminopeptidase [Aquimarina sp. 2201CG14-23]|uniref:ABC transporter permease/M1 family aminopeptidase n=1 Tax=Aquimarina mycalae TaxID=3040073 RepID=UPI002477E315|nr:M1 family aminopeptidase [Aquimarina sp. 2201CG14-23]MDH7445532.1 M1 family aminopeptidase [Aquimarina sp. 2201CG14-23]
MLFDILKFEIKYRVKRYDTYLYFIILLLYSMLAVDLIFEGNIEPIKRNAPYVIARTMTISSAFFMMITSMIMGVAALRDFDHNMESLMFVNPIKKRDYLLGRFLGSFVILLFIYCALPLGMILSEFLPWRNKDALLAFNFWHYFHPFITLILPSLFFGGAIFFVSGALSRKLMVVYVQGILLLMVYMFSMQLANASENLFLSGLLEPFSFQTISLVTQYWTVIERNSMIVPLEGILFYNRVLWVFVGLITLIIGYYRFNFNVIKNGVIKKNNKVKIDSKKKTTEEIDAILNGGDRTPLHFNKMRLLYHHSLFYFKSILTSVPFLVITACALGILLISSISLDTSFGVDSYPTTYIIVGELLENTILFFLLIIIFYSGELVWKERGAKLSLIYDALPVSDSVYLTSKLIALILSYSVLMVLMIITGIFFQISKGYYEFELGLYFSFFFVEILPFLFLFSMICFFFQTVMNHKFLSHIAALIFTFCTTIGLQVLGYDHGLYNLGGASLGTYSDMNGYGHFWEPYIWFKIYWIAFCTILFIVAIIFSVRGTESNIKRRWKSSKLRFTKPLIRFGIAIVSVFVLSGCYIFYNTNILNDYSTISTQIAHRVTYEKTLKKYDQILQPKIVDVNLKIELYPYERNYTAEGYFMLKNTNDTAIKEIHIQKTPNDRVEIEYLNIEKGANVNNQHQLYGYYIYELHQPLKPGDALKMEFRQTHTTKGFIENSNTNIIYNGTFFNNFYLPTIGYNEYIELEDNSQRESYGLEPRLRRANINDPKAILEGLSSGDGEEINFEIILGTAKNQIALAPGYLQKEWEEGNRSYFHYKMDTQMSNFYSIISAEYQVMKDQWISKEQGTSSAIDLEIYYHKGHEYNLDRMMNGMKKSFDYFGKHFSPYQYKQMRIVESPSYKSRAQSFPNTVPFSESIGFIMDIDDTKDVDMAFYVTAHEMAHQWWGHQVNPANVQGKAMLSETLAQYAALMVLKEEYPQEKVQQFLRTSLDNYLKGRANEKIKEMPLYLVESGQDYVYYDKGVINMYALQQYVSEDSVNIALKRFINDWDSFKGLKKTKTDRYATTKDLLPYFREVTPDSLQYLITDLFETVTLYEGKINEASYTKTKANKYKIELGLDIMKYRIDGLKSEKPVAINDWIEVGVYAENIEGKEDLIYFKKHKISSQFTSLEIILDQEPTKVCIDPKHLLIDKKKENNIITLGKPEMY